MQTFTIIVETENLGMAGVEDLEASLDSLKSQSYPIKNITEVMIIAGSHVSSDLLERLRNKYPWLSIKIEKKPLSYIESKMRGAELAKTEFVIYADSDMIYESSWLKNIINAFEVYPNGYIMSGDTRLKNNSIYSMSLNLTWMVQIQSDKITSPEPTTFFPLNNFAIKKADLLGTPIPNSIPLYRNIIPIWEKMLQMNGLKVVRVQGTRGYHAPPGNITDWWYRMLAYGSDFVVMADFDLQQNGKIYEGNSLIRRFFRFLILLPWKLKQIIVLSIKLIYEDVRNIVYIFPAILIGLVNITVILVGASIGVFNRKYIYNAITSRELDHVI